MKALTLLVLLAQEVDPESLAIDRAVVDEIVAARGSTVAVDPATPMGRYLRTFHLVPPDATPVTITDDVVARAEATYRYFTAPRYYPGRQVLVVDSASNWVTHRATIQEVLPGNQYKVEVVEVEEYTDNQSPRKTRTVERIFSHDEIARLNDPTRLEPGRSYFGIRYEPAEDPLLRDAIERAHRAVDEYFPDFTGLPQEIAAQQRRLYLELMKIAKVMDHTLGVDTSTRPEYDRRMAEVRGDPFYGSRGSWAGAYIKGGYGVCTDQASVATQIVNTVGRRAGVDVMLVSGITLDRGLGHGFAIASLRSDPRIHMSDPSWENNRQWGRYKIEDYRGNLLMDIDYAMGSAGYNRNRRVVRPEGEQIRTPARSVRAALRTEAAGAGKFAAAFLLKEAFQGRNALPELATSKFWGSLAVFSVAARGAEKWLPLKSVLPLAVGMGAVQFLSGNYSPQDLAISTGSFLAAGAAINLLADGLIYPALFAAGPPGWVGAGVYTVTKLAVTLYAGEKLDRWIREGIGSEEKRERSIVSEKRSHRGLRDLLEKVDAIDPTDVLPDPSRESPLWNDHRAGDVRTPERP